MPVDEDNLDQTIINLEKKINEQDLERVEMRQVLHNLKEIQMQPGSPSPGDEGPPAKVIPKNVRSDKPYTTAQRNTQYDDNIPRAEAFLV